MYYIRWSVRELLFSLRDPIGLCKLILWYSLISLRTPLPSIYLIFLIVFISLLNLSDPIGQIEPIIQYHLSNFIGWSTSTDMSIIIGPLIWTNCSIIQTSFMNESKILKQVYFQKTLNFYPNWYLTRILCQHFMLVILMRQLQCTISYSVILC